MKSGRSMDTHLLQTLTEQRQRGRRRRKREEMSNGLSQHHFTEEISNRAKQLMFIGSLDQNRERERERESCENEVG